MNNLNIPVYDVVFEDDNLGVTAVSFVDKPAIGVDFLTLKEESVKIYLNEEERRVVSPVLIPDKLIYRRRGDAEFYIRFSAEVIDELAWDYYLEDRLNNITVMHPKPSDDDVFSECIDGVYCENLWIVEDKDDKIFTEYGFSDTEVKVGSWCMDYKIDNPELWTKIKNGELKGLSVEAIINLI